MPPSPSTQPCRFELRLGSEGDRREIYRLRHDVYARELGQHPEQSSGELRDALDEFNHYIVALRTGDSATDAADGGDRLAGFISLTPPDGGKYSLDKYLRRQDVPFPFDAGLYEARILTVRDRDRTSPVAPLLIHAAVRWIEEQGGTRIMAIGRREILEMYLRIGLQPGGHRIRCGAVEFELLSARLDELRPRMEEYRPLVERLATRVDWSLPFPLFGGNSATHPRASSNGAPKQKPAWGAAPGDAPAACFHGGAFFDAVGNRFDDLSRRHSVINADVLDAWFPPAPGALAAVREELDWLFRTSPPTYAEGLTHEIARARQLPVDALVVDGGSSNLIFRAFTRWLSPQSNVLLLDPTYGEYRHVFDHVIGCRVHVHRLDATEEFRVNLQRLAERTASGRFDLVVIVNPNNPTGQLIAADDLREWASACPSATRIWVDEAYVDYASEPSTVERHAAGSRNLFVCKSLSKGLALSGARAAYLCGPCGETAALKRITPPWAVGLPAQVAAVKALQNPAYYERRYLETADLRERLRMGLERLGLRVFPGAANFLLCGLGGDHPESPQLVARCRARGLFVRDVSSMTVQDARRWFRVAVKDGETNARMLAILAEALRG